MKTPGFSQLSLLHEGRQTVVYRALRDQDALPVVLKMLRGPYPGPDAVQRFRREAAITRRVQGDLVVELMDAQVDGATPLMVLEDFGGDALSLHLQRQGRQPPAEVLQLALTAVQALAHVHEQLVVHKDVNPSNLVWEPQAGRLALIDFGISSTVSRQRPELANPRQLRGTLPYIAPEQTGRMNRSVDYRSDYYSLGATLYELLTGLPPFDSSDPLELVHAHVTRRPLDPRERHAGLPDDLCAVVMKLLSKSADHRYQSAYGLRHDLERCQEATRGERSPRTFLLGRQDRPTRVQIPERLYGRDADVAALEQALARVAAGARELVLVDGTAGIGKTALVNELHRPMVETGGIFVFGKFDQFRRGLPYASLAEACGQLCLRLMTGSPQEVDAWRSRLQVALGDSAQALADLVPELELLLGPQPPAPQVPPSEAEQRLHLLFRRFTRTLAREGEPLVLFLDDLQWADLPTIRLFSRLATDEQTGHLLLIGAWRDNEVDASHPLTHALDGLREADLRLTSLHPQPLVEADVHRFLADTLNQDSSDLRELAGACRARTGGNPFFLAQYVRMLEQSDALRFDHSLGRWTWDREGLTVLGFTDNVVELMTQAIEVLPQATQRALCVASLLGNVVPLQTLSQVANRPPVALRQDLHPAQEAGLVIQVGEGLGDHEEDVTDTSERYAFVHDRVQQAAYVLLPDGERRALHLRAGRLLQARLPDLVEREELFEVVGHLIAAGDLLDPTEREVLAGLAVAAGRRARDHAAVGAARAFLDSALALLEGAAGSLLLLEAHREAGIAAYLAQDYEGSDQHVAYLLDHATEILQRVAALEIRMAAHMARNQSAEAISTGLAALALLGIELPEHPVLPEIMDAMQSCGELLATVDVRTLPDRAVIEAAERRTAMRLLNALTPPAYLVRPTLMPLLAVAIVRMTVQEGLGPESAYGFAMYGLVLCDAGFLDEGYGMGLLGMAMTTRFPEARRVRVRTAHVWNGFVRHWKEPLHATLDEYAALFPEGIDIGDFEYAHFVAMLTAMYGLEIGLPLDRFEPQVARYTESHIALAQDASLALHAVVHQSILNLAGQAEDDRVLVGTVYDERQMLPLFQQLQHPTGLFVIYHYRAFVLYALGEYDLAREAADGAREHAQAGGTATFHLPVFFTIDALLALRAWRQGGDPAELERAKDGMERIERWAAANPANLGHKLALLRAELARSQGDADGIVLAFTEAIQLARSSAFLYDEAIAHRLAADFYQQAGDPVAAQAHLLEARYAFQRWGAEAVVARIDAEHPRLVAEVQRSRSVTESDTWTVTDGGDLDVEAVLRASQAISQEIVLSRLVQLLVTLALESSAARRAALLLERDGHFLISVLGRAEPDVRTRLLDPWVPAEELEEVPAAVINYVTNTGREVRVQDACQEGVFSGDPDVQRLGLRSVLALPVVHQGELKAILYLDNDETPGVFTGERLALARVLLAQAAISLENARHYEELEARVQERTQQLELARQEAERAHQEADSLLKNTLPETIAEELKATGRAPPVAFASATVIFTDFQDFTTAAETLSPRELVDELEECFTFFDGVMDRWGLEKLKTIGDAYMAVGGVPEPSQTHAVDCIMAGLQIVDFMRRRVGHHSDTPFRVRVGLHTGPLVAGVIGRRRFAYDVWGDTVNIASRMESTSQAGRVNVSSQTWALVERFFVGSPRGAVTTKGKGELQMVFVEGLRPELSQDGDGLHPNDAFWEARDGLVALPAGVRA